MASHGGLIVLKYFSLLHLETMVPSLICLLLIQLSPSFRYAFDIYYALFSAFQCRKGKDLYLWMAKCPNGPSVKFLVNAGKWIILLTKFYKLILIQFVYVYWTIKSKIQNWSIGRNYWHPLAKKCINYVYYMCIIHIYTKNIHFVGYYFSEAATNIHFSTIWIVVRHTLSFL